MHPQEVTIPTMCEPNSSLNDAMSLFTGDSVPCNQKTLIECVSSMFG